MCLKVNEHENWFSLSIFHPIIAYSCEFTDKHYLCFDATTLLTQFKLKRENPISDSLIFHTTLTDKTMMMTVPFGLLPHTHTHTQIQCDFANHTIVKLWRLNDRRVLNDCMLLYMELLYCGIKSPSFLLNSFFKLFFFYSFCYCAKVEKSLFICSFGVAVSFFLCCINAIMVFIFIFIA